MSLLDYAPEMATDKQKNRENKFERLSSSGMNVREAEMLSFKPEVLEKVKIFGDKTDGIKNEVHFYFTDEELELVKKHFSINERLKAVKNSNLLIEFIKRLY